MNVKDLVNAITAIESERNISKEIVLSALSEALAKAYRKQIEIPDALVRVDIDEATGDVSVFQQYEIVEQVEDDELEVSLEFAQKKKQDYQVGDFFEVEQDVDNLGRAAALLAKNVLKQKIREAEKTAIFEEYADKQDEMVIGQIESVEEKFVVVNLGKTLAMMPKGAQMPNERYVEGQKMRMVITEVNRETKGAQVLVSRADAKLVRRLFEREVPEIYEGIVEIKAIAREAGERTKIAVYSKNDNIDPIGACIGPRGSRVQVIIEELHGEKIDIFQWSDNVPELIKNALAPAQILAVFPAEDKRGLTVVVDDNQLSLAIGKKGKNARLAVKLTGLKIDIKSKTEVEEAGLDWIGLHDAYQQDIAEQLAIEAIPATEFEPEPVVAEVTLSDEEPTDDTIVVVEEVPVKEIDEQVEEVVVPQPEPVQEQEKKPVEKRVKREIKPRTAYVSKFEKLADASVSEKKDQVAPKRKYKDKEEHEPKIDVVELLKQKDYEIKPEYTEEELEEIRRKEEAERASSWIEDEIDFDEFDDYYEEE
jgi:transcription termination/antitermination protein NusA